MLGRLNQLQRRYDELEQLMARPDVATDRERLMTLARERSSLEKLVEKYRECQAVDRSLADTTAMLQGGLDSGMAALAKQEIALLGQRRDALLEEMKLLLVSPEPNDEKDVIVEIRAGTGGEEAALFAADLYRMYARYAQSRGWQIEVIDVSGSGLGAFKEIIFEISGKGAFSKLKYERGVHRVQRVPTTEASGRIHTSTATVAVLAKAEDIEVDIRPEDLKMDFYHASGAGGQNVNKLSTAVRLTHLPTGIVSTCQDERSQLKNRQKAMAVLRARLFDIQQRKQRDAITEQRRSQVGTGDRAEKIRTYNFPQDRITDHRLNMTFHNLPHIMEGNLDELIEALAAAYRGRQLEEATA
ncbi:MAG: peptide chain release factor 1 [Dehalococcoidia bacterium]|nr:peptide chain release factor 1 [Dehalococcoidia bacterium]